MVTKGFVNSPHSRGPSKCRLPRRYDLPAVRPRLIEGVRVWLNEINCAVSVCWLHRVLVGAPRDNMSHGWSMNVERPGAVYSCPLTSLHDDCTQLAIDSEGSNCVSSSQGMLWSVDMVRFHQIDFDAVRVVNYTSYNRLRHEMYHNLRTDGHTAFVLNGSVVPLMYHIPRTCTVKKLHVRL